MRPVRRQGTITRSPGPMPSRRRQGHQAGVGGLVQDPKKKEGSNLSGPVPEATHPQPVHPKRPEAGIPWRGKSFRLGLLLVEILSKLCR